jgi:hypothetical protein
MGTNVRLRCKEIDTADLLSDSDFDKNMTNVRPNSFLLLLVRLEFNPSQSKKIQTHPRNIAGNN